MSDTSPNCIAVFGMHRSGTSAGSLILRALGARHGEDLVGGLASNPKGHWEDIDIVRLNERMLEGLSMRWDSIAPVTERDVRRLAADGFIETAAGLLRNKISANGFYAVKDPRMTKLLPFWHKTFRAAAVRPYAVIVFRNPASVVASLQKRDKLSPGHGYLLWAGHMMECLCHAPDFFHFFINYDEFIENPQSVVETAAKHFRLSLDTDELEFLRRDFLSRELRHSNFNTRHLRRDAACPREIVLVCERLEQSGRACPLDADVCLKLAGLLRNCLQRKS